MGIFGRNIERVYADRGAEPIGPLGMPLSIISPWAPQDELVTFAIDEALGGLLTENALTTREIALRIPGIKRAHGIHVMQFAEVPFYLMDNDTRVTEQPRWLVTSDSGVSPFHRMWGLGSDLFFYGWGCLSFTADMSDCMHVPFGLWKIDQGGHIVIDAEGVPAEYRARPIAFPVGFGDNGVLKDAADTLAQARLIEAAYADRLQNPVPLTVLNIPMETWERWTPEERREYRKNWIDGRRGKDGSVATKVAEWPVDMPGTSGIDLFESGRNAVRLDIANHTSTPASLLEGAQQGGSGSSNITYTGVSNGAQRGELWDFGLAKRWMRAFEGRMSLDDVCASGLSIRGDRTAEVATPTPPMNPTSED
ncbi:MAG: hypothetical protein J0H96_01265 [Microbacterium ginsengisoli]|nr:hypothetical protein [Microbacterium ginsengisoli]